MSEKLKEIIENMPKDILINSFETVYEDSIKKDLEIERLNSIIKEVREYIENNWINQKDADMYRFDTEELGIEISDIAVLYDLLDKGE